MRTLLVIVAFAACTPASVTPSPGADGSPTPAPASDPCSQACAALATASCPMGSAATCALFMQTLSTSGKVVNPTDQKPLTCADVALVKTKADAIKLGFLCQ